MQSMDNQARVEGIKRSMPSLEHLEQSLRSKRDLGKLLGADTEPSGRARQIADGYIRLVEKAVLEYQESRVKLIAFLTDGNADDEYRAQDHFESCVQSLHRALTYLHRLRAFGYKREDGTMFIPRPNQVDVLRDSVRAKVRDMRDAAEHLDEDIINWRLSETAKVGIHLGWEKASLGDLELNYADVARWITKLHEFAALLSRVHLVVEGPATKNHADNA